MSILGAIRTYFVETLFRASDHILPEIIGTVFEEMMSDVDDSVGSGDDGDDDGGAG